VHLPGLEGALVDVTRRASTLPGLLPSPARDK
jgi:hypothetical protein